jgi:hypothetical protein
VGGRDLVGKAMSSSSSSSRAPMGSEEERNDSARPELWSPCQGAVR